MIQMVITTAGRQALINSAQTGTNAVTITHIGVGRGRYTPSESQTALQDQIKRLPISEGGSAGDNAFHVAYQDESTSAYDVYEFGLFLDNGILFAVYSSNDLVIKKTGSVVALLAADIALVDIDVDQIQFGPVTFTNAAATTENAGIIALATQEEVEEGVAEQKALTPANIGFLVATDTSKGLVELSTNAEAQAGTDAGRAVTPAALKSAIDSRLATNAEAQAGTNTTKAVTPAALNSRTATTERTGLVELATTEEAIAGTDSTKALTPAGLAAKIPSVIVDGTTAQKGIVQLSTTAEATTGTNTTKAVTPAGVKAAIGGFSGTMNNALVVASGGTTGRTLSSRFADGITPKDFGAIGNGTTNDSAAFTRFEAAISGRDVDLEGLTYVVSSKPDGNNYFNGFFKIGANTMTPVYDFYKYGGTAERFINVKRDFSEYSRGGAALIAANFVRAGTAAGAVVQSCVWDDVNRYLYTLHTTSGDLGVVNRFSTMKMGGNVVNASSAYTAASAFLGHQGLGIEYRSGGTIKLWASMAYETAGASVTSKGTKAVRFTAPTAEGTNIDGSIEIFNLFPEVSGSSQATTVCTSYSGKYLIAKYSVSGTNDYRVRIFKLDDLTTAGDYSNSYIHEFTITLTRDVSGGVSKALQGMACDDRYIYFLASSYGYSEKHSIYISDMYGNVVDEYRDMSVGKEIGRAVGTTYYEPESIFFMNMNGQPKLVMQIATGDTVGNRLCHLVALNTRASYFFPVGTGTGSFHAVAIDEQARIVNAEGSDNFSLWPSGLSQNTQARAGASQQALARFSNDANGSNLIFFKSRGANIGTSASAVSGDVIGSLHFLVDNGNIDYSGTLQGARAGGIYGKVFESSTLTSDGTTNIGVRGSVVIEACSDANSRGASGVEIIDNVLRPTADNVLNLGTAGRRWRAVYAMTDVISTSDERHKQDIAAVPQTVIDAWKSVPIKQFRFIEDVEESGENAKIYFGVIAQDVIAAFTAAGLDAFDYGLIDVSTDAEGNDVYGVRYREAMALMCQLKQDAFEVGEGLTLTDGVLHTNIDIRTLGDNFIIGPGDVSTASRGSVSIGRTLITAPFNICIGSLRQGSTANGGFNVCIGLLSRSDADGCVCVGNSAASYALDSISLGVSAVTRAQHSVQIGEGENVTEGSLQFRNYQLVGADGKIPDERLSVSPTELSNLIQNLQSRVDELEARIATLETA